MKLFFVDLETTGTDPEKHGVTQIAGSVRIDGRTEERFEWKVKPLKGQLVAQGALDATGQTIEQIRTYAEPGVVFHDFKNMLSKYVNKYEKTDKFFFVAYNAMFDMGFLRKWFENMGDTYFGSWFWFPPVCVMQLAMGELMRRRAELTNFKLGTVCEALGIQASGQLHDAAVDIDLTEKLYDWYDEKAYRYESLLA